MARHIQRLVLLSAAAWVTVALAEGPVHVLKDGKWVRMAPPVEGSEAGELSLLRECVEKGKNAQAVQMANAFLKKRGGDDETREEVMTLAGQAELNAERYYQAYEWFLRQLDSYPSGPLSQRALDREFKIAEEFLAGKKRIVARILRLPATDEGLEILAKIAEQSPNSAIAERAMLRIPDYHYSKRQYSEAAETYDHFLELFPKSDKVSYAMLQAARAVFARYQGSSREDTPLIDAEQRFRTFKSRYPRAAEETKVDDVLQQIADARSRSMYETAHFYERTGHPDAALYYYHQIQQSYPQTLWATKADLESRRLETMRIAARASPTPWRRPPTVEAPSDEPVSDPPTQPATQPASQPDTQPATQPDRTQP